MLYPSNYQYLVDLLSYVAVGARSVENQEHRLVSSGISVPVGMKNPTAGSTTVMLNSIYAAQAHQSFIFRNWEVECDGNPLAHAVMRGYIGLDGRTYPTTTTSTSSAWLSAIPSTPLCQSGSGHRLQPRQLGQASAGAVSHLQGSARQLPSQRVHLQAGQGLYDRVLPGGRQPAGRRRRLWQVDHDPCLGWEKTDYLIHEIAERV